MNRKKNLNPVFHLQNKKEDEGQLSKGMIKIARKSGCLNLSGRALSSGSITKKKRFSSFLNISVHSATESLAYQ